MKKHCFAFAAKGILDSVRTERNIRFHLVAVFYVEFAAIAAKLGVFEWVCLCLCFGLVVGAELMNTALENLCDAVHPEFSEKIGKAKDAAAGAVLVCAIASAMIGGMLFFQPQAIASTFAFTKRHAVIDIIMVLTLPLAFLFIKGKKSMQKSSRPT